MGAHARTADLFGADLAQDARSGAGNRLDEPLAAQFDRVPQDWRDLTESFRHSALGQTLMARVDAAREAGHTLYPADVLAALRLTRRDQVRVVILGQDPYHGPDQAHGLAFSVRPGVRIPPSLRNIFKELQRDLGLAVSPSGDLTAWAERGVCLLNTSLTVEAERAGSHAGWGWEALTDALIGAMAQDRQPKVFMLWGAHAQRKRPLIEAAGAPHLILQCNHPSPLSASRGSEPFLGCGHFGQAASFLAQHGRPISWLLR